MLMGANKVRNLKTQSGILLIECLLSILIFSVGILGLVGLRALSTQNSANSEQRTMAADLANDIVAQMWLRNTSLPSDPNLSGDIVTWQNRVIASGLPNATGTVILANGVTTVTVTWKAPSKGGTVSANQFQTTLVIS